MDSIVYLVDNGIKWRALPADFPPRSTVYNDLACWELGGVSKICWTAYATASGWSKAGPSSRARR